jgi:hypothetical protein
MHATAIVSIICVAAIGAAGCTTEPEAGRSDVLRAEVPPPEISVDLPLERNPAPSYAPAQACLLSTQPACTELDPRPFEPCLVTGVNCIDKGSGGVIPLDKPKLDTSAPRSR